jgi:hypothetical protein
VARLLAEAAHHFANFANVIDPGSAQSGISTAEAMSSGDDLVRDADRAANAFRRLSKKVVENAESAGDGAKKLTDFLNAMRPSGTASTTQRPDAPQNTSIAAAPGDAAQALIITGAAVVAAAFNAASMRKKRKDEERERSKRLPGPDPGTGEGGS